LQGGQKVKISAKLPLTITALVIVPVALVYYFSYGFIHEELHKSNESKLVAIAKIRTGQINDYLLAYELKLQNIAKEPALKKMLTEKSSVASGKLRNHLKAILYAAEVRRIVVFDANGKYLDATNGIEFKPNSTAFSNLSKANPTQVYTYIFRDKLPQIGMVTAIWEKDMLIGHIAYSFGHEWFDGLTKEYEGLGSTGEIAIAGWGTDKNAYYFTSRRHGVAGLQDVNLSKPRLAMLHALKGANGFGHDYLDYRDVPVIASTAYLPKYGIGIVVKMDTFEAHESLRRMFVVAMSAFVASMSILIALIWFVLRRIGKRVESYAQVAQEIAEGKMDARIKDDMQDEIASLGVALNSMTEKLVKANGELAKLLDEKTQKLATSEGLFENTFETANIGLAHIGLDGRFLRINDAFCSIVGFSKEEALTFAFANITHPDDIDADMAHVKELLDGKSQMYSMQKRYIRKDGSIVWTLLSVKLVLDEMRRPDYFISAVSDITSIKELEAQNEELVAHLKASNTDLQQFAYIASHDLQEPLRMVSSYVQLIEKRYDKLLDSDGKEFMEYAVDGAKRMQALINGLLEFSRVNTRAGKFEHIDMNGVLDTVKHDLSLSIDESGAVVTQDDLPNIVADENQIAQLLRNLLNNAIKYRSKAAPTIHVGYIKDAQKWLFFVRDNGIGIEEEYFDRIFLIFQRLHSKKAYPGTGIGLTICRRIADRHDGEIWVESQVGVGSTFFFTISKKLQGVENGK
jgi:PAS domain S-box-containing protein